MLGWDGVIFRTKPGRSVNEICLTNIPSECTGNSIHLNLLFYHIWNTYLDHAFFFRHADFTRNIDSCYEHVATGVFFKGPNSYVKLVTQDLSPSFNIPADTQFDITFRTTHPNATLIAIYQSTTSYLFIDIIDGQVSCILFFIGK